MNKVGMLPGLAAASEIEGPEGTAPKTVDPLEFVVFNTDELVLQKIHYFNFLFFYFFIFLIEKPIFQLLMN